MGLFWRVVCCSLACGSMMMPLPAAAQARALQCAPTRIASVVMPKGPARYQAGRMTLANGATLELSGPPNGPDMYRVSMMKTGDRVAACYGPRTTYADAGPARTITILDLRNGGYYGTLVGSWPS